MSMAQERVPLTRGLQWLIGAVVGLVGAGLAGFALLLLYADWLRDLPSTLVVYTVMTACGAAGLYCVLVGLRLLRGRPGPWDRLLLSAESWTVIGALFLGLAGLCLARGYGRLFLLTALFGGLCLLGGRGIRRARRRYRLG